MVGDKEQFSVKLQGGTEWFRKTWCCSLSLALHTVSIVGYVQHCLAAMEPELFSRVACSLHWWARSYRLRLLWD